MPCPLEPTAHPHRAGTLPPPEELDRNHPLHPDNKISGDSGTQMGENMNVIMPQWITYILFFSAMAGFAFLVMKVRPHPLAPRRCAHATHTAHRRAYTPALHLRRLWSPALCWRPRGVPAVARTPARFPSPLPAVAPDCRPHRRSPAPYTSAVRR